MPNKTQMTIKDYETIVEQTTKMKDVIFISKSLREGDLEILWSGRIGTEPKDSVQAYKAPEFLIYLAEKLNAIGDFDSIEAIQNVFQHHVDVLRYEAEYSVLPISFEKYDKIEEKLEKNNPYDLPSNDLTEDEIQQIFCNIAKDGTDDRLLTDAVTALIGMSLKAKGTNSYRTINKILNQHIQFED